MDQKNRPSSARRNARRFIKWGIYVALVGLAPLLLYSALGPAGGNPIGLGLLMLVALPAGLLLCGIGLLILLVEHLQASD